MTVFSRLFNSNLTNIPRAQAREHSRAPAANRTRPTERINSLVNSIGFFVQREASYASRHFSKSVHFRKISNFFTKITAYLPFIKKSRTGASQVTTPETPLDLLRATVLGATPTQVAENHFDSAALKSASLLKATKASVGGGLIAAFFGPLNQTDSTSSQLMGFLSEFIRKTTGKGSLTAEAQEAFRVALKNESELSQFIAGSSTEGKKERDSRLKSHAGEIRQTVERLRPGQSHLLYSNLEKIDRTRAPTFVHSMLEELVPEEVRGLISGNDDQFINIIQERILSEMGELPFSDTAAVIKEVLTGTASYIKKLRPEFYKSLKEDLRELTIGARTPENAQKTAQRIWDQLDQQGYSNLIKGEVQRIIGNGRHLFLGQVDEVINKMTAHVPKLVLQGLSASGFDLKVHERFWVEIEKQTNGKYTVRLFSNDILNTSERIAKKGDVEGYHIPLVFCDIPLERLDNPFFFRLLSYQAWSTWEGVLYSIDDVRQGLASALGKQAEAPDHASLYPTAMPLENRFAHWLQLYLYPRMGMNHADFTTLFNYKVPLEMLIHYWPSVVESPELLDDPQQRAAIGKLLNQISSEGIEQYKNRKITTEELKSLYATVWEANETLNARQKLQKKSLVSASLILPPALQKTLTQLTEKIGLTEMHIQIFKEVCIDMMGPEFEETFDLLIVDLLPKIEKEEKSSPAKPWREIFKYGAIKEYLHEVYSMKKSLLHVSRAYWKQRRAIKYILGFSINATLLEIFLNIYCPQIAMYSFLTTSRIAHLLLFFGPGILQKTLPKPLYEVVRTTFGLFGEVIYYIMERIASLTTTMLIREALTAEGIAALHQSAKMLQQHINKRGKLSLDRCEVLPKQRSIVISSATSQPAAPVPTDQGYPKLAVVPAITSENIEACLQTLITNADAVAACAKPARESNSGNPLLFYLNTDIRKLPIPGTAEGAIWNNLRNPEQTIKQLEGLLLRLQADTTHSFDASVELVVSLWSLNAIVDFIVRKHDPNIPSDLLANGASLWHWMNDSANKYVSRKTYQRLREVATYFRLDSVKDIAAYEAQCLFNWDSRGKYGPSMVSSSKLYRSGAWLSQDAEYYKKLLKDNKIKQLLVPHVAHEKKISTQEAMKRIEANPPALDIFTLLFTDLGSTKVWDKTCASNVSKQTKTPVSLAKLAFSALPPKSRGYHGILPLSFYTLRLSHLLAQEATALFGQSVVRPKDFQLKIVVPDRKGANSFLERTAVVAKHVFHSVTLDLFAGQQLESNIPLSIRCSSDKEYYKDRASRSGPAGQACSSLLSLNPRSQSAIMLSDSPVSNFDFSGSNLFPEEKRLLEMLATDQTDQVACCLSFFTNSRYRLADYRFQAIFNLYVNNMSALSRQYAKNPLIAHDIGRFFHESLHYFKVRKDWGTCLHLAGIAHEVAIQLGHCDPQASSAFGDYMSFIRQEIIPVCRGLPLFQGRWRCGDDLLYLAYCYIVASYRDLDPNTLSAASKSQVMLDIACLQHYYAPSEYSRVHDDIIIRSNDVLSFWKPLIEQEKQKNPLFCRQLMERLGDATRPQTKSLVGQWQNISSQIGFDPGAGTEQSHGVVYPTAQVEVVSDQGTLQIYRTMNDKRYRLMDSTVPKIFCDVPQAVAWIAEQGSDRCEVMITLKGVPHQLITLRHTDPAKAPDKYDIVQQQQYMPDGSLAIIRDLSDCRHDLHLLKWFDSKPKLLFRQTGAGQAFSGILLPGTGLTFDVTAKGGKNRAEEVSGKAPGYFIAEEQKNFESHPHLRFYDQSLLLKHDNGSEKFFLRAISAKTLLTLNIAHTVHHSSILPFIENHLVSYLDKGTDSFYSFTLDKQGRLETKDPAALAYLILFLISKTEIEEALKYLPQLQLLAKSTTFSKEVLALIQMMLVPLAWNTTIEAEQLVLQLAVIQQIQCANSRAEKAQGKVEALSGVSVYRNYFNYLNRIEQGATPYLSSFDELFIFKAFEQYASTIGNLKIDVRGFQLPSFLVPNFSALHPKFVKRLHLLQLQHDGVGSAGQYAKAVLAELLSPSTSSGQTSTLNTIASQALSLKRDYTKDQQLTTEEIDIDNFSLPEEMVSLELSELTPAYVSRHFLLFYHLAMGLIPVSWVGNEAKEKWFADSVNAFRTIMPFLAGVSPSNKHNTLLGILRQVSISPTFRSEMTRSYNSPAFLTATREKIEQLKRMEREIEEMRTLIEVRKTGTTTPQRPQQPSQPTGRVAQLSNPQEPSLDQLSLTELERRFGDKCMECGRLAASEPIKMFVKALNRIASAKTDNVGAGAVINVFLSHAPSLESVTGHGAKKLMHMASLVTMLHNFAASLGEAGTRLAQRENSARALRAEAKKHNIVDNKSLIAPELAREMMAQESAITGHLATVLDSYFSKTSVPTIPEPTIALYEPKITDEASVVREFNTLNKSIIEYQKPKAKAQSFSYQLKFGKEQQFKEFKDKMKVFKNRLLGEWSVDREQIEQYVNHDYTTGETDAQAALRGLGRLRTNNPALTFAEIDTAFVRDNMHDLQARTSMKEEHLAFLKTRLYLYHIKISRYAPIFKAMDDLANKPLEEWHQLGAIMAQQRVYNLDGSPTANEPQNSLPIPERVVKGQLIFESRTGNMLWKKSAEKMRKVFESPFAYRVFVAMSGDGKTYFGQSALGDHQADGNQLVLKIWPSNLAATTIPEDVQRSYDVYGQPSNVFDFSGNVQWTPETLWVLKQRFEQARLKREPIHMTKESLQFLDLFCDELLQDVEGKYERQDPVGRRIMIETLDHILSLISQHGVALIDEFHDAAAEHKMTNRALGTPKKLADDDRAVVGDVLHILMNTPEFADILKYKDRGSNLPKQPTAVPPEVFHTQIATPLAVQISLLPSMGVTNENRTAFVEYICGRATQIPPFATENAPHARAITLAKGLVTKLLPFCLSQTVHEDFHYSNYNNGKQARPANGHMNTDELAITASPYEALVKTMLLFIYDRLTPEQMDQCILLLQQRASTEAEAAECAISDTFTARFFNEVCPGYPLVGFQKTDLPAIHEKLKQNDRVILYYVTNHVAEEIRYYPYNHSSSSSDFLSLVPACIGSTATPHNKGNYLVDTETIEDPEVMGDNATLVEWPNKTTVTVLSKEIPTDILDEVCANYFATNPKCRALIDCGAVPNGIPSLTVAQKLLAAAQHRPDIKKVIFYQDGKKMVLKKGCSQPEICYESHPDTSDALIYFPQPNTLGANIPIKEEDILAVMFVSRKNTKTQIDQAMHRLRGLKSRNQNLVIAVTKDTAKNISSKPVPTIREINDNALRQQGRERPLSDYRADTKELSSMLRKAVRLKRFAMTDVEKKIKIANDYRKIFINEMSMDPIKLFGGIDIQVPPTAIFEAIRGDLLSLASEKRAFNAGEIAALDSQLRTIGDGLYPDLVDAYSIQGTLSAADHQLGQSLSVRTAQDVSVEQSVNLTMSVHQNFSTHSSSSNNSYLEQYYHQWPAVSTRNLQWCVIREAPQFEETTRTSRLLGMVSTFAQNLVVDPSASEEVPPLFSIGDVLAKTGRAESIAIAHTIDNSLLISNNMAHLIARNGSPIEPFGPGQIPIQEVLLLSEGTNHHLLVINQQEVRQWHAMLAEDRAMGRDSRSRVKIGIYNIGAQVLTAQGANAFTPQELASEVFQNGIVKLKFLRGDVQYNPEQYRRLRAWMQHEISTAHVSRGRQFGVKDFMQFSERVRQHHATHPYPKSRLAMLFTLLETPNQPQPIRC